MASLFHEFAPQTPEVAETKIERNVVSYTPRYQRFLIKQRSYTQQYSHIYTKRILQMRSMVLKAAAAKWKDLNSGLKECKKVIDLRPDNTSTEWLVIGCIYKDQPLKPSILDEYSGDRALEPPLPRANYSSVDDSIVIEDESGRVALCAGRWSPHAHGGLEQSKSGAMQVDGDGGPSADGTYAFPLKRMVDGLVTGVVIGVRGVVCETGELAVSDICVPGFIVSEEHIPRPLPPVSEPPVFALVVSSLKLGAITSSPIDSNFACSLLLDFVSGLLADTREAARTSRIARIVIAGNITGINDKRPIIAAAGGDGKGGVPQSSPLLTDRYSSLGDSEATLDPLRDADCFLAQLAATVPVDLMPGDTDPSNVTMPQQPLHPVLFQNAARYSSFRCVTNPYDAEVAGLRLLGCSGQAVTDIARYARSCDVMRPGDELQLVSHHNHWAKGVREENHSTTARPGQTAHGELPFKGTEDETETAPNALVQAVSSTAADASLKLIAGTGAGAGYETRAHADVAEGDEIRTTLKEIDLLENTLSWRHMAPTCPDTLGGYPFYEIDPFVMETLPDVYFSGAARAFDTRLVDAGKPIRLISVPDFSQTGVGVLINLSSPTLEAQPIAFMPQF